MRQKRKKKHTRPYTKQNENAVGVDHDLATSDQILRACALTHEPNGSKASNCYFIILRNSGKGRRERGKGRAEKGESREAENETMEAITPENIQDKNLVTTGCEADVLLHVAPASLETDASYNNATLRSVQSAMKGRF